GAAWGRGADGGHSSGERGAVSTHHDDHDGRAPRRAPDRPRARRGGRVSDAARFGGRGWAVVLADAHAVRDARLLRVPGSSGRAAVAQPPAGHRDRTELRRLTRKPTSSYEPTRGGRKG